MLGSTPSLTFASGIIYRSGEKMPIEVKNLQKMSEGQHNGIIIKSEIVDKVFKPERGPEKRLELTIQPQQPEDGVYNPISTLYTVAMNPHSHLGKLANELGVAPDFSAGGAWDESCLNGIEVTFDVSYTGQFANIVKDTIRKA